jgi:hypothetical protein
MESASEWGMKRRHESGLPDVTLANLPHAPTSRGESGARCSDGTITRASNGRHQPTMTRPSLRWAGRFGGLGYCAAVALLGLLHVASDLWGLRIQVLVLHVTGILWPSALWLLATAGQEDTVNGWMIVAMSIAANAALYAFVGTIISVFRRSVTKRTSSGLPSP